MTTQKEIREKIEAKIADWDNGNIVWNVGNQFDPVTLQSALENLNDETFAKAQEFFAEAAPEAISVMDWAWQFSTFEEPDMCPGWID